jgi:hypothetical protein
MRRFKTPPASTGAISTSDQPAAGPARNTRKGARVILQVEVYTMRWTKADRRWVAVDGKSRCEIDPPGDPKDPIQMYSWAVRMGGYRMNGGTSSLAESKQAAEQEAAILKHREHAK